MTERICALTVILERDIREDDCESITKAIQMVKGVKEVKMIVRDPQSYSVESRLKAKIFDEFYKILRNVIETGSKVDFFSKKVYN